MTDDQSMNGYLRIIAAALIWGSVGVVVRIIDLPVPVIVLYRVFFASVSIFIYIALHRKTSTLKVGKNLFRLIIMGILLTTNWMSIFYAVKLTSVANAMLLTYTAPILVAFFAPVFLKEHLERITILTLALSSIGIALIAWPSLESVNGKDTMGIFCAGLAALTYAILIIMAKPMTLRANVLAIIFYEELICTILLTPVFFIYNVEVNMPMMLILFMLGVVQTAIAAGLYLSGLRDVKAQHAGIFTYLDPASAIIFAIIFLNEIPSLTTLAGGALIIVSGMLLIVFKRKNAKTKIIEK